MENSSASGMLRQQAEQLIDGDDYGSLEIALSLLNLPDATSKSHAETLFSYCKNHYAPTLCVKLAYILRSSQLVETRIQSAILLRRFLIYDKRSVWSQLATDIKAQLKAILIESFLKETNREVAEGLRKLISAIALQSLPRNEWPELIDSIFLSLRPNFTPALNVIQESALLLFAELSPQLGGIVTNRIDELYNGFLKGLRLSCPPNVKAAAVKALVYLIAFLVDSSSYRRFPDLLNTMGFAAFTLIGQKEYAHGVLEDLIMLVGSKPGFFGKYVRGYLQSMLMVALEKTMSEEDKTKHLAIEFMITLAEERDEGRHMARDLPEFFIRTLLKILMKWLSDIDKDSWWDEAETDDDHAGESSDCCYAKEGLARAAIALRGDVLVPYLKELVSGYYFSREWQRRHAFATTLAQSAEGCSKTLLQIPAFMVQFLALMRDPFPRLRWATINAIMEFSKYLGPEFQDQYHQDVLPALTQALNDFKNPRVQARAASAMLFFCQKCTPDLLNPYLQKIMSELLKCLEKGEAMVKEGALSALASIASSSEKQFQEYYDTILPYLKVMLISQSDKSHMLLAKSLECITTVGAAAGKEKFHDNVDLVMQVLLESQKSHFDEQDDPMRPFVLEAWGRFCKCLGQEFLPYMSAAMPLLIKSAQLKNYVSKVSLDPDDADTVDDNSIKTLNRGSGTIQLNKKVLNEKATACKVLCWCAAELNESFYLWAEEVTRILIPLTKFEANVEIKTTALSAIPVLLRSLKSASQKGLLQGFIENPVKNLSALVLPALFESLSKEMDPEVCGRILDSLNECIQIYGSSLPKVLVRNILDDLAEILITCSFKKNDAKGELRIEEDQKEEKFHDRVGNCFSSLIKIYWDIMFRNDVLPSFEKTLSCIQLMWKDNTSWNQKRIALRILNDVSEHSGEAAFKSKHYQTYIPHIVRACQDANPEVRQIAASGIGVCAEFGGPLFTPYVNMAHSSLTVALTRRETEAANVKAYVAAVSALGKICQFQSGSREKAIQILATWEPHLPLKDDFNQAKMVHETFSSVLEMLENELVEIYHPPRLVAVILEILWARNHLATDETCEWLIEVLKTFDQKLEASLWVDIKSSLQPGHQSLLKSLLSS